jgi:hypothetical protein
VRHQKRQPDRLRTAPVVCPWPSRGAPGAHPCKKAYNALKEAGHSPQLVKSDGFARLPDVTRGRKEVKRLTGESWVPVLLLDDGEAIKDSKNIVAWARENPAAHGPERRRSLPHFAMSGARARGSVRAGAMP